MLERRGRTAPCLDVSIENNKLRIEYENLNQCVVNYHRMDLELLFSTNPLLTGGGGAGDSDLASSAQFNSIKANEVTRVALPADLRTHEVAIPAALAKADVMVEVSAGGLRR